ncbi:MAG TPA: aldo/keto reductase [Candidatus Latescibacteria bacterium]|nr:aldo/keto reductase [Gemmatimonadota bacterium]HCR19368.1 aldo/keto reductase [Candidatus Latescibacterota bacterium]
MGYELNYRLLCRGGPQVSEIGFGGGPLRGRDWGPVDDAVSVASIHRAMDLGVTFFDTADAYGNGHSEEVIGKGLIGERAHVLIATKGGWWYIDDVAYSNFSKIYLLRSLDASLKTLGTDYVDLYQIHDPDAEALEKGEIFEVLDRMKASGKIRFGGASVSTVEEGLRCIEAGGVDVLQVYYNILDQRPDPELFEAARTSGTGLVVKTPLGRGLLTGKYSPDSHFHRDDFRSRWQKEGQLKSLLESVEKVRAIVGDKSPTLAQTALRFVLSNASVSTAIPGAKTPKQAEMNAMASQLGPLSQVVNESLKRLYLDNVEADCWD